MSPGDVVFVRRGLSTLAGVGVVTGDYRFDEKRKESKQVRSVNWLWKGEVKTSIRFSRTTLANISDEDKIKELCSLSGLTEMDLNHYESSKFISSEETMIHDKSGYKSDKPRNFLLSPEEAEERLRTIKRTVKAREVLQREGQRELRNLVVSKSGCCCVTGLKIDSMLIVSHIKDWKYSTNEERLDPENVLLLAKNYDAAFDRKLISFDSSGRLLKSNSISWKELALLGIKKSARLTQLSEKREKYLAWHRDRLLE
jgi:predicted restriction endonuclease